MFGRSIFREKAIEKMMVPDDMDELIQVTEPGIWLLLSGLLIVLFSLMVWVFFGTISRQVRGFGIIITQELPREIVSEVDGQVDSIYCRTGDQVKKGDRLVKVVNMVSLTSNYICASCPGEITGLNVREGFYIRSGTPLLEIMRRESPGNTSPEVIFFVSEQQAGLLEKGMIAGLRINKQGIPDQFIKAKINFIAEFRSTKTAVQKYFQDKDISNQLKNSDFHEIRGVLIPGNKDQGSLTFKLLHSLNGYSCSVVTTLAPRHPIEYFFH